MIVVLDTTSLHGDVFAERAWVSTLLDAATDREDLQVWIPSVVLEELARQFPERLERLVTMLKRERHQASAFGWELPPIPDFDQEVEVYRDRLEDRLHRGGVEIVGPPERAGLIAEWVARRREPIPGDGSGVVDAQVWLTAVEAAEQDEVILITDNHRDFCDPADRSRLHPTLCSDMETWGVNPDQLRIVARIVDFNTAYVAPSEEAAEEACGIMGDVSQRAQLASEIEEAVLWFPAEPQEGWEIGVDTVEAVFGSFNAGGLNLLRADPRDGGIAMTLEVYGAATIDFSVTTEDALHLVDTGSNLIDTWELDEPLVSGQFEPAVAVVLEAVPSDGGFGISVEGVREIEQAEILALLESWVEGNPLGAREVVSEDFDAPGEQEATAVRPREIERFRFENESVYVRAEFRVDYANPVDEEDRELSAENVTEHVVDLRIETPDLSRVKFGEVSLVRNAFPD
jgi:hypothetical protein